MEEIKNTLQTLAKQIAEQIINGDINDVQYVYDGWFRTKITLANTTTEQSIYDRPCTFEIGVKPELNLISTYYEPIQSWLFEEYKTDIINKIMNKYNEDYERNKQAKIAELESQLKELKGE